LLQILAQSSTQQPGGSLITLLLPVAMIAGLYFLMIRPQRNRQRQQQAMLSSLRVGDEVMISGGIFGILTEIDEDAGTVHVEIAPGTEVRLLRQGILQRLSAEDDADLDDLPEEGTDDRS
jgi:preprotein translocase subunit YajC